MARKPKTPRAAPASSAAEVRVKMTAAFTYQLGPSARRTLPAGWCGMVPAAIATRLEAEKAGARVTVEEEGDAVTTKPPKPADTSTAAPKPAATSAVDAKPSASAATGDSAKGDQAGASQSPQPAATSPAAPAAAEPGTPAASAAAEAGGASDPASGSTGA